jgi:type I restriction enzyme S subunit
MNSTVSRKSSAGSKRTLKNNTDDKWRWLSLGEITVKAQSVKRKEKNPNAKLIYLDIGGIDNEKNIIRDTKEYSWKDAPSRAQQIVERGDILFSTVRTYMKNVAMVKSDSLNGQIASSGFCVIRAKQDIALPEYLFHYVLSETFLRPLNELQTGSSYPAVRDKDVLSQPIHLPSLDKQRQIVSKIEELFSELDKGIESLKLAQQQLRVYRQAVLKWAFEGRLTNENVRDEELREGWRKVKLGDLFTVSSGKGIKVRKLTDGQFPVYGGNGINGYHSEYMYDSEMLIIGRVGVKCGVTHITKPKSWVTDNALIVSPINPEFNVQFYKLKLQYEDLNKLSVSTAQPVISGRSIYAYEIEIPESNEQREIVNEIDSRFTFCDKLEESINQSLQQVEMMRQSILNRAFEGSLIIFNGNDKNK